MIEYDAAIAMEPANRGLSEPEWMPSPAEVARARAQMERASIVRSMARGLPRQLVPAGATPWLWVAAAAVWILVWPALIALRLAQGQPAWLPWWLPLILALINLVILAGPVLYSERIGGNDDRRRRFTQIQTVAQMLALEPSEFEAWTGMLFQLLGYQVENTQDVADHGIDLIVSGPETRYGLVQCKRYRGTVGEPTIRDLFGVLIHENGDRAWLVTTGGISRQARDWANGKPIDLWDGLRLVDFSKQMRRA
jgi:restriction system protein